MEEEDEVEEEEEDEEEDSEYEAQKLDDDYQVDTDEEYDSDCLNYDIVKKQLINRGQIDVTQKRVSLRQKNDDGSRVMES